MLHKIVIVGGQCLAVNGNERLKKKKKNHKVYDIFSGKAQEVKKLQREKWSVISKSSKKRLHIINILRIFNLNKKWSR